MPYLAAISIFPIKSLDGVAVLTARVLESGALAGDREFAIVDAQGHYVNGKRTAAVHKLRSTFDLEQRTISLQVEESAELASFHLDGDRTALEGWLSDYFGFSVQLIQNSEVGFPDDMHSPGPTIVGQETLQAVATWFPGLDLNATRQRFRTNLEIAGAEPFWDDCLFDRPDTTVPFRVGKVLLEGVNPCQRCVVVTRDAMTGQVDLGFQKTFTRNRKETLPTWANPSRFNHFFRLAVNTRISSSEAGKVLSLGDQIEL